MWLIIVIVLAVVCTGFYIWVNMDYKKRKKEIFREKEEPLQTCRSEDNLEEYGKKIDGPSCPEPEE